MIPTPPKPNSHKSLITRNMRLKFLFPDRISKPHPFHVKSNWQPPPQPSVALENYLERTKYEIATISFCDNMQDNLSAKEREALKKLIATANHTRSTSNQTGNRHHNLQWHLKTTWNEQNMRLLQYICYNTQDNLSAKEREALKKLRSNTKVNIKKADQRNTTVVMDTQRAVIKFMTQITTPLYRNQQKHSRLTKSNL